jgi:hypothetical protein
MTNAHAYRYFYIELIMRQFYRTKQVFKEDIRGFITR